MTEQERIEELMKQNAEIEAKYNGAVAALESHKGDAAAEQQALVDAHKAAIEEKDAQLAKATAEKDAALERVASMTAGLKKTVGKEQTGADAPSMLAELAKTMPFENAILKLQADQPKLYAAWIADATENNPHTD